jgi:Uma2 family endonuclease
MASPKSEHTGYTYADYLTWEGRWELIHGEAFAMTPAPSPQHQEAAQSLFEAIGSAMRGQAVRDPRCKRFLAPIDVILGLDVVQPDLVVVCDPRKITMKGIEGAPDLVVEIVSASSATRDHMTKRWLYEANGIPEYLILDPAGRRIEHWILEEGRYVTLHRAEDASRIEVSILEGRLQVHAEWEQAFE